MAKTYKWVNFDKKNNAKYNTDGVFYKRKKSLTISYYVKTWEREREWWKGHGDAIKD